VGVVVSILFSVTVSFIIPLEFVFSVRFPVCTVVVMPSSIATTVHIILYKYCHGDATLTLNRFILISCKVPQTTTLSVFYSTKSQFALFLSCSVSLVYLGFLCWIFMLKFLLLQEAYINLQFSCVVSS